MPSPDKSKIFVGAVNVYIADRASEGTPESHSPFPGTNWDLVGYMKAGSIKLTGEIPEIDLHDGQKFQTSAIEKFELLGLETDETKRGVFEGYLNKKCDIIFKPVSASNTRVFKLLGANVSHAIEGTFGHNEALAIKVTGQVIGLKPSDVLDEITLA